MDETDVLALLHILGAFLLVAGIVAETLLSALRSRTTSTRQIAFAADAEVKATVFAILPGSVVLAVFGTWLVARVDGIDFEAGWITGGYLIWIVATLASALYLGPHAARIRNRARRLIRDGVEESPELQRGMSTVGAQAVAVALDVLLVVAIYLMVVRPGE